MHRAIAGRAGNGAGLVGDQICGLRIQPKGCFGDGGKDRTVVQDLMRVAELFGGINAAGQHQHWHPGLMRIGHHIHAVERTRPKRCHQNDRGPIAVVDTFSHKARSIFVFGQMKADASLDQRVHQGQDLTAGHAKGVTASGLV